MSAKKKQRRWPSKCGVPYRAIKLTGFGAACQEFLDKRGLPRGQFRDPFPPEQQKGDSK